MKTMIRNCTIPALVVLVGWSTVALADDTYNERYGETRFSSLPHGGMTSKTPWVGSWWAYIKDGMAYRWNDSSITNWKGKLDRFSDHNDPEKLAVLSPAEKLDKMMGRSDKIQLELIEEILKMQKDKGSEIDDLIEERRDVVYRLNNLIEENADNSDFNWKDSEDGKKYLELGDQIDEASEEYNSKLDELEVDTATEFEIKVHGNAQFGVGSWFGHCNAWAAAAIVEEEPRHDFEHKGIPWTAADVKGLLTSTWMECNSSFYGSRNDHDEEEEAREKVDYQDVTPAAFHIFFADQIGNRDKSFVIDRYTGDQVWNQPVNAYRSKFKALYDTDEEGVAQPEKVEWAVTKYDHEGRGKKHELGERELYPVSVKTTIWWVTDGLPHDELTVQNVDNSMSDADFANHWKVKQAYDDQIHIRTLSYTLWLDKPMEDEGAIIVGDGKWNHGSSGNYAHNHPDFMWQPLANTNNPWRVYENELIPASVVRNELLPKSLIPPPEPEPTEEGDETPETEGENGDSDSPESEEENAEEHSEELSEEEDLVFEVNSEGLPLSIPDHDLEGATSMISVETDRSIASMMVGVDIHHTFIGDLQIDLIGPAQPGNEIGSVERTAPGCDHCSCQVCVCEVNESCCNNTWSAECVHLCNECGGCEGPIRIRLKEQGEGGSSDDISKVYDVKGLQGKAVTGEWKLHVVDHTNLDTGSLKHWFLEFFPAP